MKSFEKRDKELYKIKLQQLERKLRDEEIQNEKTFKMKLGEFVEYGNFI